MKIEELRPGFYNIPFKKIRPSFFGRIKINDENLEFGKWKYLGKYKGMYVFRRKGVERILMHYFGKLLVVDNFGFICPPTFIMSTQKKMFDYTMAGAFYPLAYAEYPSPEAPKIELRLMYDGKWACLSPINDNCNATCYYAPGLGGIKYYRAGVYEMDYGVITHDTVGNKIKIEWHCSEEAFKPKKLDEKL